MQRTEDLFSFPIDIIIETLTPHKFFLICIVIESKVLQKENLDVAKISHQDEMLKRHPIDDAYKVYVGI